MNEISKRIHAELNFRLMHLSKLLQSVETTQVLPLPWIDVDEGGGPREIARKMRAAWMLPPGPVGNLTEIAERAGIIVIWCDFGAPIDGVTMNVPGMPPNLLGRSSPADRQRDPWPTKLGT